MIDTCALIDVEADHRVCIDWCCCTEVVVGEENEGWTDEQVEPEACSDAITAMRGFRFHRPVLRLLHYTAAGLEATTLRGAEVAEYLNT